MTAQEHNKVLGILYLVQGGFNLMGLIFTVIMIPIFYSTLSRVGDDAAIPYAFITAIFIVAVTLNLILGGLDLLAGYGLLKRRSWARTAGIIAAITALLGFPLGTALGVYGLWFLFGEKGRQFYLTGQETAYLPPPPPQFWKQP